VASIPKHSVVVYHASGCHLCERALEQVRVLREELDFELREVDISGDQALEEA
jgi:glutaredoxin